MRSFSFRRLHAKGVLTLGLVILARQINFSDAVSWWKRVQRSDNHVRFPQGHQDASATTTCANDKNRSNNDGSCSIVSPAVTAKCCQSCPHLIEPSTYALHCRGGDQSSILSAATPYGLPLHVWKILMQVFLTGLNVACWLIPLRSKSISENKLALSLANAFSGGVFLSLAFGHLLPECLHGFGDHNEAVPFLLVLGGYLLIFFVEKVAFDAHHILESMDTSNNSNGDSHPASSGRSAVILLGALAVHSILEMMALGLADSFGDAALLTLSISLHQPAESIALLVAFLKSGLSHTQIITFLSVFSCMGPIGVGLGMLVNEFAAPIVDSIMLAIVAGTFVYVGATEVIPEEWEDGTYKWSKFAALMSGIASIIAITQYTQTLGK